MIYDHQDKSLFANKSLSLTLIHIYIFTQFTTIHYFIEKVQQKQKIPGQLLPGYFSFIQRLFFI